MFLCIDVGNTTIHFGVYKNNSDDILCDFKIKTGEYCSDEIAVFLFSSFQIHNIDKELIRGVGISSVVPTLNCILIELSLKYLHIQPLFLDNRYNFINLEAFGVHGLGGDRLAGAISAVYLYPNTNLVTIDCGTATTVNIIAKDTAYISGAILPGIQTSISALQKNTALLPSAKIKKPINPLTNSTENHIHTGSFYMFFGGIRTVVQTMTEAAGWGNDYFVVGSGGAGKIFKDEEGLYDVYISDLVLFGVKVFLSQCMNRI